VEYLNLLCRLRFNGVRGYGVYIRHAEILSQPSIVMKYELIYCINYYLLSIISSFSTRHIYTDNFRQATASDTYILRGDSSGETYEPRYDKFMIMTKSNGVFYIQIYLSWFSIHSHMESTKSDEYR
jgi:hypothetical protein